MTLLKSGTYSVNKKNKADGLQLLADINDGTVAAAFSTHSIEVYWIN